jgi:hypothetical protein
MKNIWKIVLIVIGALLVLCLVSVIFLGLRWLPSIVNGYTIRGIPRVFIPNNPLMGPGIYRRYMMPGMPFLGRVSVLGWVIRAGALLIPLLLVGLFILAIILLLRTTGRSPVPASTAPAPVTPTPVPANSGYPCPNCGRQVQADWVACPYCGQNLKAPTTL